MKPPPWSPDWTNRDHYPNPKNMSLAQWACQFLRPNQEYQKLWAKLVKPTYKRRKSAKTFQPPIPEFERLHITKTSQFPPPCPSENEPDDLSFFDVLFGLYRGPDKATPLQITLNIDKSVMVV